MIYGFLLLSLCSIEMMLDDLDLLKRSTIPNFKEFMIQMMQNRDPY